MALFLFAESKEIRLVFWTPAMEEKLILFQNGLVQFYALAMMLGLTVFLLALIRAL